MTSGFYRFTLGKFQCVALQDGSTTHLAHNFFSQTPRRLVESALRQRGWPTDHVTTPRGSLYIDTGQHQVLIDIGAGNTLSDAGQLLANMQAAGITPGDIDRVIITHAHPGHIGGAVDKTGQLVFSNARYYLWKGEWDFWTAEAAMSKAPEDHVILARENLEAICDQLHLVDYEAEIVPGVHVVQAPGHTPGHMAVAVTSNDEKLLHIADIALHPLYLEYPGWTSAHDILPAAAAASKRRIFDRVADEGALVFAHHFAPFPNLGHVIKLEEGWRWQPIDSSA
jgi:glyoxylase-like metal-dependent hydrolase (beta-lactamase superfamily II)